MSFLRTDKTYIQIRPKSWRSANVEVNTGYIINANEPNYTRYRLDEHTNNKVRYSPEILIYVRYVPENMENVYV